ncbi:MAG: hypothetical protein HY909_25545 [Deltaproteobacteria bacterium]|nr:hypothetical protein [Deltaproteobacteria bacterium]
MPTERSRGQPSWVFPCALLAALAFTVGRHVGPPGPLYWDSFAYVGQAVTGRVGGLLLGRPAWVLAAHLAVSLARALGATVAVAEPLLRYLCLATSALAAPLTARLSLAAGLSPREAWWAGLVVALSPAAGHAAFAALTDGPAMTLSLAALTCAATGRWAAAGALAGLSAGVREPSLAVLVPCALLAWREPRRARCLLALSLGASVVLALVAAWALTTQPGWWQGLSRWREAMQAEREAHHHGLRDLGHYALWVLCLGPAAVCAALLTDRARFSPSRWKAFALWAPAMAQLALLALYQDIAYAPRYLLGVFPCAVALPAGVRLARSAHPWRWLLALGLPAILAGPYLRHRELPLRRALDETPSRLRALPPGALVVTGQPCPAVTLTRTLALEDPRWWGGAPPSWRVLCPAWGRAEPVSVTLFRARREGVFVVLDDRPGVWVGPGQRALRAEVLRWASALGDPPAPPVYSVLR